MRSLEGEIFDVEGTERYSGAAPPRQSRPTSCFTITDGKIENGQFTATLTGDDSADEATVSSFDSVRGIIGTITVRFFGPNAEGLGGAVSASRMNDDPSDPVLDIAGIPFRLSDDARAASGTGFLPAPVFQYSPVIDVNLRGVLAASVAGKIYRNNEWNDISIQSDLGVVRLFDGGEAAGGIRLSQRWLDDERYSFGFGLWTRSWLRLSPVIGVGILLNIERREHPMRMDLDGQIVRLRPGFDYTFSARTSSQLENRLGKQRSSRETSQPPY